MRQSELRQEGGFSRSKCPESGRPWDFQDLKEVWKLEPSAQRRDWEVKLRDQELQTLKVLIPVGELRPAVGPAECGSTPRPQLMPLHS